MPSSSICIENGVDMLFGYECDNIILEGDQCKGVYVRKGDENVEIFADHTVIATGTPRRRLARKALRSA